MMSMSHFLRAIVLLMTLSMLNGCGSGSSVRDNFCLIYDPVYTSPDDTEETRKQNDGNNAVWLEKCEKKNDGK